MRPLAGFLQSVKIQTQVFLCGAQTAVAKQELQRPQVGATRQHVDGVRVAQ